MPERDGYLPGVPCWVDTSQPDPEAATAFYGGLFGWDFEDAMPPGSAGKYFVARLRGGDVAAVGSQPEDGPPTAMWNTYVWVDNADEAAAKARDAGGRVVADPFDVLDAGRMAVLTDPEGALFCVWQAKRAQGRADRQRARLAQLQRPEHARRRRRAKSFYGSLFGWEALGLDGGVQMWRLPGYGDFLEKRDPGLRERMAESGAPKGFEDVVATLTPIADDQPDTPAHWSVTFAVDDADATAAKAEELGGQVIVAPFDAPWVRMTVISDPQGATFIASQFVPENKELGG